MIAVCIEYSISPNELEGKVNNSLKTLQKMSCEIKDIKYSSAWNEQADDVIYSAMILYEGGAIL